MATGLELPSVKDMGEFPNELPFFALPQVPFTFETPRIILPYALTLTMIGLLESLMTAALVAVMIMVSINSFQWQSLRSLIVHPKSSSFVMLATVVVVVWTHDLPQGVLVGVILSGLFVAQKVLQFFHTASDLSENNVCIYRVTVSYSCHGGGISDFL